MLYRPVPNFYNMPALAGCRFRAEHYTEQSSGPKYHCGRTLSS